MLGSVALKLRRAAVLEHGYSCLNAAVTVALHVKVFDGIVLATDSAVTHRVSVPPIMCFFVIHQVYNSADKLFHLHRELPVAAMFFGLGRYRAGKYLVAFQELSPAVDGSRPELPSALDIDNFTVEDVAKRASAMFAQAATDAGMTKWPDAPRGLGYVVAGISTDCDQAEVWSLRFEGATLEPEPEPVVKPNDYGYKAYAQPEPVNRLFKGYDEALRTALINSGVDKLGQTRTEAGRRSTRFSVSVELDPVQAGCPCRMLSSWPDYIVETTEGYARYRLGPDTVGGPVEVASISPHEGFKWIHRKHYYGPALNPGEQT